MDNHDRNVCLYLSSVVFGSLSNVLSIAHTISFVLNSLELDNCCIISSRSCMEIVNDRSIFIRRFRHDMSQFITIGVLPIWRKLIRSWYIWSDDKSLTEFIVGIMLIWFNDEISLSMLVLYLSAVVSFLWPLFWQQHSPNNHVRHIQELEMQRKCIDIAEYFEWHSKWNSVEWRKILSSAWESHSRKKILLYGR